MNIKFTWLSILLAILSGASLAQTNSVLLKDGNNVVLSSDSSISAAYAGIPGTLSQEYIIEITASYTGANETFPISFVAKSGASSTNTITLRPALGVTSVTVTNTSTGSNLFVLDDADYVIIDGRPGGTGTQKALTFWNTGTTSSSNTIALINGASNNILRFLNINNSSTGSAGRSIFLGTSTGSSTGNSDNLVEFCDVLGGRYSINSNGTVSNPNINNIFYGNNVDNVIFAGFWFQSGTGKVFVDSNTIHCTTPAGTGPYGILFDSQTDTATIIGNHIYGLQNSGTSTGAIKGISVRSTSGTNLTRFINNMIALSANSTNVAGIELIGSGTINSQIYHNTIRISGSISSIGTSGNVGSSGLLKSNSGTSSTFDVKNNIVVNERSGGNNLDHVAVYLSSLNGTIDADYNTYYSTSGDIIRVLTTVYTSMSSYQTVVSPIDANSNSTAVQFVSSTDLHLTGTSIGDPALNGTTLALVTTDFDNDPRAIPVKGADEIAITGCSVAAGPGVSIANDTTLCSGETVNLTSEFNSAFAAFYTYQWQSSTNGVNYSDISGATTQTHSETPTTDIYYRLIITCIASSTPDTASPVFVEVDSPMPSFTISETHTNLNYNFSSTGTTSADSIRWEFGDGSIDGSASPSYSYSTPGAYTVLLILSNNCSTDTATYMVNAGCSTAPDPSMAVVNDSTICEGNQATLSLNGLDPALKPVYGYQWQSSTDGTTFSNIVNATSDIEVVQPVVNTYYRAIITCSGSGLEDTSSVVMVTVDPLPSLGSISASLVSTTNDYSFTASGVSNAISYLWDFGDGSTSTQPNPSNTFTDGTYTVTLIVTNPCGSDTATLELGVTTSIGELSEGQFSIFPNPASDVINIVGENLTGSEIQIFEVSSGKMVHSGKLQGEKLNVDFLLPGFYMVRLTKEGNSTQKKFVISK